MGSLSACLPTKLLLPCPPLSLKFLLPWKLYSTRSLGRCRCTRRTTKKMVITAPARVIATIAWSGLARLSAQWPRMPWRGHCWPGLLWSCCVCGHRVCVQLQAGADGVEYGHHASCCLYPASCQGCKEGWDQEHRRRCCQLSFNHHQHHQLCPLLPGLPLGLGRGGFIQTTPRAWHRALHP